MNWKRLLVIALVTGGIAFVPAPRSDAGVSVGIGFGIPVGYYGYGRPYYGYYRPYRYYRSYRPYRYGRASVYRPYPYYRSYYGPRYYGRW